MISACVRTSALLCLLLTGIVGAVPAWAEEIGIFFYVDSEVVQSDSSVSDLEEIESTFDRWVEDANTAYARSKVDLSLKIVGIRSVNVNPYGVAVDPDGVLSDMRNQRGSFGNLFHDADVRGADYVYTVVHDFSEALCGQAIGVNSEGEFDDMPSALATSEYGCDYDTFIHELGNLQGLAHGDQVAECHRSSGHRNGAFTYARGWGYWDCDVDTFNNDEYEEFGTVMVHNYIWGRDLGNDGFERHTLTRHPILELFSNPRLTAEECGSTRRCGSSVSGDAARVLQEHRATFASHNEPDVAWLNYEDANLKRCFSSQYADNEVQGFEGFSCVDYSIRSLEGLQQLPDLSIVALTDDDISVLTPLLELAKLGNLKGVNLTGNEYALCHQLDQLEAQGILVYRSPKCFNLAAMIAVNSLSL
jgi:hypothetical protein